MGATSPRSRTEWSENSVKTSCSPFRSAKEARNRAMGMEPYYLYRQKNMKGNLENTGFAKPGKECLYNILIMEEAEPILAAGAGASSKYIGPDGFISRTINPKNVETYLENTDELIEKKRKAYYESRLSKKRTDR